MKPLLAQACAPPQAIAVDAGRVDGAEGEHQRSADHPVVPRPPHVHWLLAGIASLLTLVLVLGSMQELAADSRQAIASAMRDNEKLVRAFEEHIAHTFMNTDKLVWSVKQQVERRGLPDDLGAFVRERTLPGAPILVVLVTDAQGNSVRHSMPGRQINISDRTHFRQAVQGDTGEAVIGLPRIGQMSGKWSLHVVRRINKPDGSLFGVVSAALDQTYFEKTYRRVDLGHGGYMMVVGTDGIVRAQMGATGEEIGKPIRSVELVRRMSVAKAGSFVASPEGGQPERLVAYRTLERYPLAVVVGTSAANALDQGNEHRRDYYVGVGLIGVLVWVGFSLLGWLMVQQHRARLELQAANRRVQAANRVKSDFLANMTHELRTPLDKIIGCADCLREGLHDDSQRECARIIYSSGCSLLGMVNSVLDAAQIEAGRMTLSCRMEALPPMLQELAALHGPVAEGKGLSFALKVGADLPAELWCDRVKLTQVLNNLLNNAIKFTERGRVVLSARRDGDAVSLAIRDTGCGISPAMQQAIFERFNQGEQMGAGLQGGTGLGLALARELAELMGGRMEVESEVGRGSEFRVRLPIARNGRLA